MTKSCASDGDAVRAGCAFSCARSSASATQSSLQAQSPPSPSSSTPFTSFAALRFKKRATQASFQRRIVIASSSYMKKR